MILDKTLQVTELLDATVHAACPWDYLVSRCRKQIFHITVFPLNSAWLTSNILQYTDRQIDQQTDRETYQHPLTYCNHLQMLFRY